VLIAGDIGGTKTILALYSLENGLHEPLDRRSFPSAAYGCLEDIIREFLGPLPQRIDCATFGVAGPVVGNTARITNLPWVIDARSIGSLLGTMHAYLLNDLEAVALGIPLLQPGDLHVLNAGEPSDTGPVAVIAPGTGLGEAYLTWDGSRYRAHASEGGHADFAPKNAREMELLAYLLERHDHVSYERICSGSGIPNIYAFLRDKGYCEEPAWLADELKEAPDATILIRETAQDKTRSCALCKETLSMFVSILGAEAGNLALKVLPTGGIYLAGGIPPRIIEMLEGPSFLDAFLAKGRLSPILKRMPIQVILHTDIGLTGAAGFCMDVVHDM
jgi:glucokinase